MGLTFVHLAVQVDDIPLFRIMQNVSQRFTKWINHTQSRTGHLFQGRYKVLLIDADSYLLELVRYIHLNPVRAGASSNPEDYPWIGHHAYLGKEFVLWVLSMFSPHVEQARSAYASFVHDGMGEGRRGEFHSGTYEGRILGDDSFTEEILFRVNQREEREYSLEEVIAAVCAHYQISPEKLQVPGKVRPMTEARAVAAAIVQQSPHLRMTDLAKLLGRDMSALGKAAQRAAGDERICGIIKERADKLRTSRMSEC